MDVDPEAPEYLLVVGRIGKVDFENVNLAITMEL